MKNTLLADRTMEEKMKAKFKKIADQYSESYMSEKCPDQIVMQIQVRPDGNGKCTIHCKNQCSTNEIKKDNIYPRRNVSDYKGGENKIIIVLESPHKDEFEKREDSITPAPALGTTGRNLNKYLCTVLENVTSFIYLDKHVDYDVILINSIQFQCSLGVAPKIYRSLVFSECWSNDLFKEDFKSRLKDILSIKGHDATSIVINCCTIGGKNYNFHESVGREIDDVAMYYEFEYYEGYHPCIWSVKKLRKLKSKEV